MKKKISEHEHNFLNLLKDTNIIPGIEELTDKYVIMEKYPITLGNYIEQIKANAEINENTITNIIFNTNVLINKLHSMNIFHGDLHTNNIVINPTNGDIRLIDFGESRLINKINENDIEYFNDFLDPLGNIGEKFKTVDDLLNYEYTSWILDF